MSADELKALRAKQVEHELLAAAAGDITNSLQTLMAEVAMLRAAMERIIEQCPKPKLPYGCAVVAIATGALQGKYVEGVS
jgi:hypothetical protein